MTSVVPHETLRTLRSIPVKREGNNLWVVRSEPINIAAVDEFRVATGLRIIPVLAVQSAIVEALRRL